MNKLVLLAVLVVLGTCACWHGFAGSGDTCRTLAREAKRGQALEQQTYQTQRRLEAKQRVIVEVVAGRMGLAKAARRFAEINTDGAEETAPTPTLLSFDEVACSRNVLNWARAALASDAAQAARILPALEEEYRQRFRPSPDAGNGN